MAVAHPGMMAVTKNEQSSSEGRVVNQNGVPHGQPDPKLKCALFRALNPRTETYQEFCEDVGSVLEPELIDAVGIPLMRLQKGPVRFLMDESGPNTSKLDDHADGLISHKDLMWEHRAEIADLLEERSNKSDNTITPLDIWYAKKLAAEKSTKKYNSEHGISFGSFVEIPLIFLFCGGNVYTGKVNLDDVLEFFDGKMPTNRGFVTRKDVRKVVSLLKDEGIESPCPLTATNIWGFIKVAVTSILSKTRKVRRKLPWEVVNKQEEESVGFSSSCT